MAQDTQISALISDTTRERLERHARATGIKKGHLVEQALLHHLQALEEVPVEYIVHPRIALSADTFDRILQQQTGRPSRALRDLMRDGD